MHCDQRWEKHQTTSPIKIFNSQMDLQQVLSLRVRVNLGVTEIPQIARTRSSPSDSGNPFGFFLGEEGCVREGALSFCREYSQRMTGQPVFWDVLHAFFEEVHIWNPFSADRRGEQYRYFVLIKELNPRLAQEFLTSRNSTPFKI